MESRSQTKKSFTRVLTCRHVLQSGQQADTNGNNDFGALEGGNSAIFGSNADGGFGGNASGGNFGGSTGSGGFGGSGNGFGNMPLENGNTSASAVSALLQLKAFHVSTCKTIASLFPCECPLVLSWL